jgi:hypothetical protein
MPPSVLFGGGLLKKIKVWNGPWFHPLPNS